MNCYALLKNEFNFENFIFFYLQHSRARTNSGGSRPVRVNKRTKSKSECADSPVSIGSLPRVVPK